MIYAVAILLFIPVSHNFNSPLHTIPHPIHTLPLPAPSPLPPYLQQQIEAQAEKHRMECEQLRSETLETALRHQVRDPPGSLSYILALALVLTHPRPCPNTTFNPLIGRTQCHPRITPHRAISATITTGGDT